MLFSANETNFLFDTITIDNINSGDISREDFQNRFYADIVKDGQGAGPNLTQTMRRIYTQYTGGDWQRTLNALEKTLFEDNLDVKAKTTLLKNIIKTSTVGSNIKISHATNVFWESGFGSAKIMATPIDSCEKYQTPAAQLDSLSKEDAEYYWPEGGVTFDSAFLEKIGFPAGMRWEYNPGIAGSARGGAVTITYSDVSSLVFNVEPFWNNATTKDENGVNGKYLAGNNYKNDAINSGLTPNEFRKYVETKEFGDVAQVLVYLAFVLSSAPDRTTSVMITTDGVVQFLNLYFNLSSIYTGSRRGVESGCCNLYSYLAGDVNLEIKFKNMIENYYQRIKSQLTATKFGFTIMLNNPSQFWYYRNKRGTILKTNGAFKLKPDVKNGIRAFFNDMIGIINYRIDRIDNVDDGLKTQGLDIAATFEGGDDSAAVDEAFTTWCARVDTECKIPQILTKLTNGQYILHPGGHPFLGEILPGGQILPGRDILPAGDILGNYTQLFINDTITIATVDNLKDAIGRGDQIDIEDVFSGGGRHRVIRKSNNNLSGGGGPGGPGSYYDYIFLCYVNNNMFQNITTSIADYSHEFAFLYDWTASQIDPNRGEITFDDFNGWFNIQLDGNGNYVSGKTDNDIYSEGEKLQKYVYFADDYDAEEQQLEAEALSSEWHGWTRVSAVSAKGVGQPMSHSFPVRAVAELNFNWDDDDDDDDDDNNQYGNSNNQSIQPGSFRSVLDNSLTRGQSQDTKSVVEAPGNNSIMSPEDWDLFNVAVSREDTTTPVVEEQSKLASPDKGQEVKKRRTTSVHSNDGNEYYSPVTTPVSSPRTAYLNYGPSSQTTVTANLESEANPESKKQTSFWKSFFGSKGGKRRTMKAKKYLKNNRKKTLRKNNKKTIRKTIRKNKKTRKSKH